VHRDLAARNVLGTFNFVKLYFLYLANYRASSVSDLELWRLHLVLFLAIRDNLEFAKYFLGFHSYYCVM